MRRVRRYLLAPAALAAFLSGTAQAATVTTYTDEAAFLAAVGAQAQRYNADATAAGTPLTTQVPGITFSSPNGAIAGAIPVQVSSSSGAASRPNLVAGGYAPGSPGIPQVIALQFGPGVLAFGAALSSLTPDSVNANLVATFSDATTQSFPLKTSGNKATFLGLRSNTPITRVEYIATKGNGGQAGFKNFGIDNLGWLPGDGSLPLCSAEKAIEAGVLGFNGTSTDQAPGDTGIASVSLVDGVNVALSCAPPFPAGCGGAAVPQPTASWRIAPSAPGVDGSGTVVATDGEGQSCSFHVTFTAFGGGEADSLVVCRDTGLILLVSNGIAATPGQIVCGSTFPGPGEPAFPAGYEPSPESDPNPCRIFTIKSPISGTTLMTFKKDGDFEPRLRLLFSRFDGATFPAFTDITQSVEQIDNILPDPTRLKGSGTWSQVKVACAVQAEVCNGLDDDGDGQVDEGIPTGAQAIDCDHDGYPLCATGATTAIDCSGNTVPLLPGAAADCNDNLASVNAGAAESCNGFDDDCDGDVDEGAPAGGAACHVEGGLLGPCATGVTSCAGGPMECIQTVFPTAETCNQVDDDCDGTVDEGHPAGGVEVCNGADDDCDGAVDEGLGTVSCGTGACARTVDACSGGSEQTCVPGSPSTEACNSLDDDCDGQTDEGLGTLSCGTGVCARTVPACSGGQTQACVPGPSTTETCNGLDDDCDGVTDEEAAWSGLLQPVNQDGSSIFQQKSTIPLKLKLTSCTGQAITNATVTLEVLPYSEAIIGTVDEGSMPNARADIGDLFRFDSKGSQYMYNLGTKPLSPGRSYLLRIRVSDGSVHETIISLK